ncbi:endonuclease/exonuclease/phosphatase family protein [Saccharopolyspora sp. NPDC002376]
MAAHQDAVVDEELYRDPRDKGTESRKLLCAITPLGSRTVQVCSTHLKADKDSDDYSETRKKQAHQITGSGGYRSFLEPAFKKDLPIIMTGDFNEEPSSAVAEPFYMAPSRAQQVQIREDWQASGLTAGRMILHDREHPTRKNSVYDNVRGADYDVDRFTPAAGRSGSSGDHCVVAVSIDDLKQNPSSHVPSRFGDRADRTDGHSCPPVRSQVVHTGYSAAARAGSVLRPHRELPDR